MKKAKKHPRLCSLNTLQMIEIWGVEEVKDDNDEDWHECLTLMLSVLRVMGVFKEVYGF